MRAVAKDPQNLPHDVLFRDLIHGRGPQRFAVKVGAGDYDVYFLHPDHTTFKVMLRASDGKLEIPFPNGEWSVSGLVIKRQGTKSNKPLPAAPALLPRPEFRHDPPTQSAVGKDLTLTLSITDTAHVKHVRLYYRPLNQFDKFKMIEHPPNEAFVLPKRRYPREL